MTKTKLRGLALTALLVFFSLITIFPFYLMIVMGTHVSEALFKGIALTPGDYLLKNLTTIAQSNFLLFYFNSLTVSTTATVLGVLVSAMAGFALSKYKFRFRNQLLKAIIMIMMIPGQISLIAYIIEMRTFHLLDTLWPIIILFIANPFGVFWMKQSIDSGVPDEVLESARIDGASEIRIFFSIVLPFVKAALITISLLLFLWSWNCYLVPLIAINNPKLYTVPLGIAMLNGMYRSDYAAKILALTIGTLPLVILFLFGSKYFIRGLTSGAVKG